MPSGAVDPITNPEAWHVIEIGQSVSPGVCKIGEFKRAFQWDVKKGKGTLGGTITFVGRPPAKGTITFYLWTPDHFVAWDLFRPLLKYDPTKQAVQAVDIYHPSLADVDIHSVVVENIGNIMHEGQGLYSIQVDYLEYFPPPKTSAVGTPTGSSANAGGKGTKGGAAGDPPDPVADAQQKEIAALMKKASEV